MVSSSQKSGKTQSGGIGLITCLSLVTATMVGTGVYTSLGFQLLDLRSGFSILVLWALGGAISLCGALSYAELAAQIPRSGGEYTYLSEIYHPAVGFMAGFVSLIAGFAAPIAIAAIAFGTYLHTALPACPAHVSSFLAVLLLSAGHLRTLRFSSVTQNAMTALKFLLVGLFLLIGLWNILSHPDSVRLFSPRHDTLRELLRPDAGIALLFVLYAYSGWNASSYLAGEVRDSQRTVGRSLILGTALVTLLYVMLNGIFLTSAPAAELRGVLNVGSIVANHLIGPVGGCIMSGMIALGLLASISAMIWAGPRVTQRIGQDHALFAPLGKTTRGGIPMRATLLQMAIILIMIATGSFESVLLYSQTPLLLCLILGVGGVGVLRLRRLNRGGFHCPLYPLPPLVFILCTTAGLVYSACSKPWIALAGILTMMIPLVIYPWIERLTQRKP
jgi:APA family basic amino acid/polyamine antiporter